MQSFLERIGPNNRRKLRNVRLEVVTRQVLYPNMNTEDFDPGYIWRTFELLSREHKLRTLRLAFDGFCNSPGSCGFERFFVGRCKNRLLQNLLLRWNDVERFICTPPQGYATVTTDKGECWLRVPIRVMEGLKRSVESTGTVSLWTNRKG